MTVGTPPSFPWRAPAPGRPELLAANAPAEVDFFAESRGLAGKREVEKTKAICQGCPVRSSCLAAGLQEEFGVWGGLTLGSARGYARAAKRPPEPSEP